MFRLEPLTTNCLVWLAAISISLQSSLVSPCCCIGHRQAHIEPAVVRNGGAEHGSCCCAKRNSICRCCHSRPNEQGNSRGQRPCRCSEHGDHQRATNPAPNRRETVDHSTPAVADVATNGLESRQFANGYSSSSSYFVGSTPACCILLCRFIL